MTAPVAQLPCVLSYSRSRSPTACATPLNRAHYSGRKGRGQRGGAHLAYDQLLAAAAALLLERARPLAVPHTHRLWDAKVGIRTILAASFERRSLVPLAVREPGHACA